MSGSSSTIKNVRWITLPPNLFGRPDGKRKQPTTQSFASSGVPYSRKLYLAVLGTSERRINRHIIGMKEPYGPFSGTCPDTYVLGSEFPRAEAGPIAAKKRTAQALGTGHGSSDGLAEGTLGGRRGDDSVCIPEITARGQPHIVLTQVPLAPDQFTKLLITKRTTNSLFGIPKRLVAD